MLQVPLIPRGRFAEALVSKGLVTGRREQHTRDRRVTRSRRPTSSYKVVRRR